MKELEKYARIVSTPRELLMFLKSLPKSLEDFYELILKGLEDDNHSMRDRRDGKRILQFCLLSHRGHVELNELHNALAIPGLGQDPEPDFRNWQELDQSPDILKRVTHCAGGFIDII